MTVQRNSTSPSSFQASIKANLTDFGLQRRSSLFLTRPSPRDAVGLPCEGVCSLSRHLHEDPTSDHQADAFGPTYSMSKAQRPNKQLFVVASNHWLLRCAQHHGETHLCISLPFLVSFIANIARKRPELSLARPQCHFFCILSIFSLSCLNQTLAAWQC